MDRNYFGKLLILAIASSETKIMNYSSLLLPVLDEDLLVQVKVKWLDKHHHSVDSGFSKWVMQSHEEMMEISRGRENGNNKMY